MKWCCSFFSTQKWPRENDVIISKDKCHSGTYSFITWNCFCLHVETQLAHSWEDQLNMIFFEFLIEAAQEWCNRWVSVKAKVITVFPWEYVHNREAALKPVLFITAHVSLRKHSSCQRSAASYFTINVQTCFAAIAQHSLEAYSLPPVTFQAEEKTIH